MATFLELCQWVASDSGTIGGVNPTAVTGQTGRLEKVVRWTNDAWRRIQTQRTDWRWMRRDVEMSILANTRRHAATSILPAADQARFADWLHPRHDGSTYWSAYPTASGVSEERPILYLNYEDFYTRFLRGTQTANPLKWISFDAENQIIIAPVPDVDWTIRGRYRRNPQVLAANGDEPEMPERYHEAIKWRALMFLFAFDENEARFETARLEFSQIMGEMIEDQTPPISIGAAAIGFSGVSDRGFP